MSAEIRVALEWSAEAWARASSSPAARPAVPTAAVVAGQILAAVGGDARLAARLSEDATRALTALVHEEERARRELATSDTEKPHAAAE